MKKYIVLPTTLAIIGLAGLVFIEHQGTACPDDFKTFEESSAAYDSWVSKYSKNHPEASLADMVASRREFYVQHNCTAALKRFDGQHF